MDTITFVLGGMLFFALCFASFVFVSAARMYVSDDPLELESEEGNARTTDRRNHRESSFPLNINGMRSDNEPRSELDQRTVRG